LARNGGHEFTISEKKKGTNFSRQDWTGKSALIPFADFHFSRALFGAFEVVGMRRAGTRFHLSGKSFV
jgi:hypothetical protein